MGRKFICFAKFLYIFFHRLLIIASQYYEGPISPCTLVSVSLTASGHPACDLYDAIYLKGLFDLISWTVPPGFLLIFTCHSCIAPSTTKELPEGYVERVKHVHDSGGYGSRGYGIFVIYLSSYLFFISLHQLFIYLFFICPCRYEYDWSKEEANKNLPWNHKTAVSARMLYVAFFNSSIML